MGLYTPYIPSQKMTRSERIEERIRQWRNRRSETDFFKNAFDEATNLQVDLKKLLQQVSKNTIILFSEKKFYSKTGFC